MKMYNTVATWFDLRALHTATVVVNKKFKHMNQKQTDKLERRANSQLTYIQNRTRPKFKTEPMREA